MIDFTVTNNRGRTIRVKVHKNRKKMLKAAEKWNGTPNPPDTRGITQAWGNPQAEQCIIRLNLEDMEREVVDHETLHAAMCIYGKDNWQYIEQHPAEQWTHWNEQFAHLFSFYQGEVHRELRKHGVEL